MSPYTLLTGATGLVGSYLLRDLLVARRPVAVVARSTKKQTAAERIETILSRWEAELGHPLPRPVCLEGDVTRPNLGFDEATQNWVAHHCRRVIHNAAVLKFLGSDRQQDPWRTNLDGTRHLLELCRSTGLRDFHYVSTAYVSGRRQGPIREDELDVGQSFRNDYEQSKFLAEQAVRTAAHLDAPTVYRPVVIAGDSQNGFTTSYHGIYVYLRLMDLLLRNAAPDANGRHHVPLRIALDGDERRNLVPVDWVSQVICHLSEQSPARGQTFHLAPRVPITARQFFEAAYSYFNCYGVEFCGTEWQFGSEVTDVEQAFLAVGTLYRDYERTDPEFDTTNLQRLTGHLPCPAIDEQVLHRYWRFGHRDRWGKRRAPTPSVTTGWAEDVLQRTLATLRRQDAHQYGLVDQVFGIDIVGPGGGQFQITTDDGAWSLAPGLPNADTILSLSVDELAQVVGTTAGESTTLDPRAGNRLLAASSSAFLRRIAG